MRSTTWKTLSGILLFAARIKISLISILLVTSNLQAQCVNSGFQNASNFITDNSTGVYDFASPGYGETSNNNRAVASSIVTILSGNTYFLKATGFNFNIPSDAQICGVRVEIERRATGLLLTAFVRDNVVRLIKGGTITGDNKALPANWVTSENYASYGNSSDLWNVSLTPADVNTSNFGIAISVSLNALVAALPTAEIDHIRMSIDYNVPLPVTLNYFNASKKGEQVLVEWQTGEEEDHGSIDLQRSFDNREWETVSHYDMHFLNNSKKYTYSDPLPGKDSYYRLKITQASGSVSYSAIKKIQFNKPDQINIYPNPASDYILIENAEAFEGISVVNSSYQKQNTVVNKIANGLYRIDLRQLSRGIYFIRSGSHVKKFVRQ